MRSIPEPRHWGLLFHKPDSMAPDALRMPYRPSVVDEPSKLYKIYQPLHPDEIRLLQLTEHDESGVLLCNLQYVCIDAVAGLEDAKVPYTAISYMWDIEDRVWYGHYSTEPKAIYVDGELVMVSDKVANILSLMCQVRIGSLQELLRRACG